MCVVQDDVSGDGQTGGASASGGKTDSHKSTPFANYLNFVLLQSL